MDNFYNWLKNQKFKNIGYSISRGFFNNKKLKNMVKNLGFTTRHTLRIVNAE